jgi:hypothetical protein
LQHHRGLLRAPRLWHSHTAAFDRYIFLHENRVSALGHHRAGENANSLAGFHGGICTRAGRKSARNRQCRIAVRTQVRVSHRISIDGGIVERRQIDWCFHIVGHNATASAMQRHTLSLGDRRDPFCNQPLHIIEPQERTRESKAVVGKLRHQKRSCSPHLTEWSVPVTISMPLTAPGHDSDRHGEFE